MKTGRILELQKNSGYSSELLSTFNSCNLARIQLLDGSSRELTQPKLGRDFVSGLLEDESTYGHFRKSSIRSIEFAYIDTPDFLPLSYSRRSVGEMLLESGLPRVVRYSFRSDASQSEKCRALGVSRGLMLTDHYLNSAIPLAALSAIEVSCE